MATTRAWWQSLRYATLLPATARSRAAGALYARLSATIEYRLDAPRRAAAVRRIRRWLAVDGPRAHTIFWKALHSEACEEADVCWLMRHPGEVGGAFRLGTEEPPAVGAAIWASFHLGTPTLAFVYLRCIRGIDVRLVGRPLDDANPMPDPKRAWGSRKVDWLETFTGVPFLGTSAADTSAARTRLLHGASIFVLMDVPGDITARTVSVNLFGEEVRIAAGVFVLAGLLGVPIRPIVAVPRGGRIEIRYGDPIEPVAKAIATDDIARTLTTVVRDLPDEWWLWPYVPSVSEPGVGRGRDPALD